MCKVRIPRVFLGSVSLLVKKRTNFRHFWRLFLEMAHYCHFCAWGLKNFFPNLVREFVYQCAKWDFRVPFRILILRWSNIGKK